MTMDRNQTTDWAQMADGIQSVIGTLQTLDMKPTYDNMNHLMGCLTLLAQIRDGLRQAAGADGPDGIRIVDAGGPEGAETAGAPDPQA